MSVAAEILKYPILKIARARVQRNAAKIIEVPAPRTWVDDGMAALVRQLFFAGTGVGRTRTLFAAAGPETNISSITQRAGLALSEISEATVAVIERRTERAPVLSVDEHQEERGPESPGFWRKYASQIAERLWRVKAEVLPFVSGERSHAHSEIDLPFDYFLLAATVNDSMMPLFCRNSEGAVLVLTANKTRKEAAIQAKRVLEQCDAELLGTVLDGRKYPVPESIYQRL